MADRYFVMTPISGDTALIVGAEAHHLAHVMRAKPGHEVVLFDGSGAEFSARVQRVGRAEIELSILQQRAVNRELPHPLVLGVALPKGDRQRWLIEKAVELGATRIVPLETERSIAVARDSSLDRLGRAVIEASKQCGRNRLLEIAPPQSMASFIAAPSAGCMRLIAHPGGPPVWDLLHELHSAPRGMHLAVGPEGGFTEVEVETARQQCWQPADLGRSILRVETAAVLLVGMAAAALSTHVD